MTSPIVALRDAAVKRAVRGRRRYFSKIYGMEIGDGTRISMTAKLDKTNPHGVKIGSNSAIAFGAAILSHDYVGSRERTTTIGDNCFIGARSIIMPGVTVGDGSIVGAGSVVHRDVPAGSVVSGNPAVIVESGIRTGPWGIRHPDLIARLHGRDPVTATPVVAANLDLQSWLLDVLRVQAPAFSLELAEHPLKEAGLDSFGLVAIRAEIEQTFDTVIAEQDWQVIRNVRDMLGLLAQIQPAVAGGDQTAAPRTVVRQELGETKTTGPARERRIIAVNMPQMALGGLSESWLFKEIGDVHWSMITHGLQTESSAISDETGARLYATFTRIKVEASAPLAHFLENDRLTLDGQISRFGAGMFFGDMDLNANDRSLSAHVMSSFSKRGEAGANTGLLKGQPTIPDHCAIPKFDVMPEFANEYRAARKEPQPEPLFQCEYDLIAPYDINGVGLLYFAAYPMIVDICTARHAGKSFPLDWSTRSRDVNYFANSDPTETLIFRLHRFEIDEDEVLTTEASLSRSSDGVRMARVITEKVRTT